MRELEVDALAQEIRRVDGNNNLGAGALAEALMPFLAALPQEPAERRKVEFVRLLEPGQVAIFHPDFPPHYWDGERMIPFSTLPAAPSGEGR